MPNIFSILLIMLCPYINNYAILDEVHKCPWLTAERFL
jgi:hypothetical protein